MHLDGWPTNTRLVRRLLADQQPHLAAAKIKKAAEGYDNAIFRIGSDLCGRFPRHREGATLLAKEQKWLPYLATLSPLPVPMPIYQGRPAHGYPFGWTLVPWIPGRRVSVEGLGSRGMSDLVRFLSALHITASAEAPLNIYRGMPPIHRQKDMAGRVRKISDPVYRNLLASIYRQAVEVEPARESVWLHGDLHPLNVITQRGQISGILDWGDLAKGDRASDCGSIWLLGRNQSDRKNAVSALALNAAEVARSAGWAAFYAAVFLAEPAAPIYERCGMRIAERLNADREWLLCP